MRRENLRRVLMMGLVFISVLAGQEARAEKITQEQIDALQNIAFKLKAEGHAARARDISDFLYFARVGDEITSEAARYYLPVTLTQDHVDDLSRRAKGLREKSAKKHPYTFVRPGGDVAIELHASNYRHEVEAANETIGAALKKRADHISKFLSANKVNSLVDVKALESVLNSARSRLPVLISTNLDSNRNSPVSTTSSGSDSDSPSSAGSAASFSLSVNVESADEVSPRVDGYAPLPAGAMKH